MKVYKKVICNDCGDSLFFTGNENKAISNHRRVCRLPLPVPTDNILPVLPVLLGLPTSAVSSGQELDGYNNDDDLLFPDIYNSFDDPHSQNVELAFYHHQELLLDEYFDDKSSRPAFWVRTATKDYTSADARGSWETYVKIFDYVRSNQLSQQQGTNLLRLFQDVSRQNHVSIPLPSNMETIEKACMRGVKMNYSVKRDGETNLKDLHKVEISSYKIPELFFGTQIFNKREKPLLDIMSARMSLPHRIAEVLLEVNPDDFAFDAPEDHVKEISEFAHGSVFSALDDDAKARHGKNAVALCLSISLDSATVNSSRNRTECPVVFSILNVKGTASYHLIGYCPIKFPYTDGELSVMMSRRNINGFSPQKNILSYCYRQMKREYLDDILKPLLKLADVGFKAQVGYGDSSRCVTLIPHLCMIVGDTEELGRKLTGVRELTGCRCCTSKSVNIYDPSKLANHIMRDDNEMNRVTSQGEEIFHRKYEAYRAGAKQFRMEGNDKRIETELDLSGLHPGTNPLYKYFQRQRELGVNSYHEAVVPDHLHTVQLGVVCYCVSWVMQIVFAVKYLDPKAFGQNVSIIDNRIINIETVQSYEFIRNTHFRCGISKFFAAFLSCPREVLNMKGTGISTGTIHAWQYSTLLLHLYFALVPSLGILPNDKLWWTEFYDKIPGNSGICTTNKADRRVNIFEAVISAMTCVLDFYFLSTKRCFVKESLGVFKYVTGNMRIHLHVLDRLRRYLGQMLSVKYPSKNPKTKKQIEFTGIKPHLCEHMVKNIEKFGPIITTSDTQVTEGLLKYVCKSVFQQTSKQYKNLRAELINAYFKNHRAFALSKSIDRRQAHLNPTPAIVAEEAAEYHFFSNFAHTQLVYDDSSKMWLCRIQCESKWTEEKTASCLHPFLDANRLVEILSNVDSISSVVFRNIQQIMRSSKRVHDKYGLSIVCYKAVTIYNRHHIKDNKSENEPFTIHCNREYRVNKDVQDTVTQPVFSSIEINYEDGCSYCQLIAIVEVGLTRVEELKKQQFLVVCRLAYIRNGESPLPFGLYGYENNGKCIDVIPIGGAYRPCITYEYKQMKGRVQLLLNRLYFIIPYDRFGKTTNTNWEKHGQEKLSQYEIDERISSKQTSFPMYASIQRQQEQLRLVDVQLELERAPSSTKKRVAQSSSKETKASKKARRDLSNIKCDDEDIDDSDDEESDGSKSDSPDEDIVDSYDEET